VALISCPECGAQVSDAATACPKCGHPLKVAAPARVKTGPFMATLNIGCLIVLGILGFIVLMLVLASQ
jgi:uncharacterized membrane protein YvbJ